MRHKGFLLATAAGSVAAASGGAQAADLAYKAAVAPPPAASWEGWYIGLHAGAAWQQGHANGSSYTTTLTQTSSTSFIGGGQVGYNWQHGNFVYGWESDISGLTNQGSTSTGASGKSLTQKIKWLSTVRGRAGLAVGDTMAYVTAGIAFGQVSNTLDFGPFNCCSKSESKTRVGWTVGGGVEHMITRNWTAGLEALFVDLGRSTVTVTPFKTTTFSNQAVIGRLKLNYKW
jgi:outer membrane immunogenic protein